MTEQLRIELPLDADEHEQVRAWAAEWDDAERKAQEFGAHLSSPEAKIAPLVLRLLAGTWR